MIGFTRRVRVFAYAKPADMRKHYDGLYALVVSEMKADPLSGDLFLFTTADAPARRYCCGTEQGCASIRSDSSVDVSHCCGVEATKKCSR